MSRDIRSFFNVISKKNGTSSTPTKPKPIKRPIIIDSSDEDVIADSPIVDTNKIKAKRRKVEKKDEKSPKRSPKTKQQSSQKLISPADFFGTQPVKQSKPNVLVEDKKKLEEEEKAKAFQKTLDELDDDLMIDEAELDRTIEEVKKAKIASKKTPQKRNKLNDELNDSGLDPDEERHERRRQSSILYQKYLNRSGPAHKGEKELPKGKADCLKGLCFLKTGVLDSLDKDEFDSLVKEHGGRTVSAVSRKVNYLVVGEDPGPAKLEKARGYGIAEINEDELLDLILVKSGLPAKYAKKPDENVKEVKKESPKQSPSKKKLVETKIDLKKEKKSPIKQSSLNGQLPEAKSKNVHKKIEHAVDLPPIERQKVEIHESNLSWTEKYKPMDTKSIIGQQTDKSNMHKLLFWLRNWSRNHSGKNRPKLVKPSPWAKSDDGAYFKCALLSGAPGVGKTTTATLVAKELGFDVVEFNASDTRSKKLLHEEISQLLSSKSIATYFKDGSSPTSRHVLLMDEVDGMAGNEDRGGLQELINLIKNTNVPIICMCNDRQHPKMRTLVNYCFDLRFTKPRLEQIRGSMMSICFKEGVKISSDALNEIIQAAGMDIRQTLNNLAMWSAKEKNLTLDGVQKDAQSAKKDTVIGPWEVIRKVFSEEEQKSMSFVDKSKLFFYDYSIAPLFVQENYLQVAPHCDKKELLKRVALTADAISMGDIIDKRIRSSNNWSLLDSQAYYASVMPGAYMRGHFTGQINFPSWLGKNSKRTKFQRLCSELQSHMRTSISGGKLAVNLDYIYHLRNAIVKPLVKEGTNGVGDALTIMRSYNLLREDLDSIVELSQWPKQKDPMAMVESKVKAAFTRAYNKEGPLLPYASTTAGIKKKTKSAAQEEDVYGEEDEADDDNDEDEDDLSKNAMIKEKKKPTASKDKKEEAAGTSKKSSTTAKGKTKKLK